LKFYASIKVTDTQVSAKTVLLNGEAKL